MLAFTRACVIPMHMREEGQVQSPADVGLAMQVPNQHVRQSRFRVPARQYGHAHSAVQTRVSLREGYKVFLERLELHYSQLPPTEDPIRKIGYA
jgi:hypothetical protein